MSVLGVTGVTLDARGYLRDFVASLENIRARWRPVKGQEAKEISFAEGVERVLTLLAGVKKSGASLMFIGNGGSAAIASHQVADFTKIGIRALAPLDPSLLTCFANDFGYENAFANVIKVSGKRGDVLFAISSSGESRNILNAVAVAKEKKMAVVTLSGFNESNPLRKMGEINFYVPSSSYRCVESAHLFIFNCILDFFLAVTNYRPAPIWS